MSGPIKIFTDGGSRGNPGLAASAFVVLDQDDIVIHQEGHLLGITTNNQAEYQAVLFALKWLMTLPSSSITVKFYLDSQLVVNQINGVYKIKDSALKTHLDKIHQILSDNPHLLTVFTYVPRARNFRADALVNMTLDASAS